MAKRIFLILCILVSAGATFAQTTAFSYQGRLSETGSPPVTGTRFFRFTLFDENGAAIPGATVEQALMVTQGVFSTSLDFGAGAFPGANRSLQISVKTNAGDAYTDLNPRQNILAVPYSVKSKEADNSAQLGGVDSSGFVQQDASGNVSIGGNLTVAGTVTYDTVNATTQYNLGGERILSVNLAKGTLSLGTNTGNPASSNLSIFLGQQAGRNNTIGDLNTFVGYAAGTANTTGMSNSFVGQSSGGGNKTGADNSYFGRASGFFNESGSNNSIFGSNAGYFNKAGNNSFFGSKAGFINTTGAENSFFGAGAGANNTTGGSNAFFGINAGISNADGSFNSFFGNNAGYNNTSGGSNNFFGGSAGSGVTTGSSNSFFGDRAGLGNGGSGAIVTGSGNTMLGSFTTGAANLNFSTAIGANASVTQSNSIVLGAINGINGATADTNVGIGTTAPQTRLQIKTASGNYGFTQTDGAITIGSYVGGSSSGATGGWLGTLSNNKLFFFTNSGQPSMTVDTTGNVGIGTITPASKLEVKTPNAAFGIVHTDGIVRIGTGVVEGGTFGTITNHPLFFFTNDIRRMSIDTSGNVGIGTNTPNSKLTVVGLIETTTGGVKFPDGTIQTTAGGVSAGTVILNQTTQQTGANFNVAGTGEANIFNARTQFNLGGERILGSGGTDSLFAGIGAGRITTSNGNAFFGTSAGFNNTTGESNSFFGRSAGFQNTTGSRNSFFGTQAGRDNNDGIGNSFFGWQAGISNTTGVINTFVGDSSGKSNVTGSENSFFGANAGFNNNAGQNSFFGSQAGRDTSTGGGNTFVGNAAGFRNTTGFQNTFVGSFSGAPLSGGEANTTGSNNTFVGVAARPSVGNLTNATALGAGAVVSQSNSLVLGNNANVGIGTSAPNSKLTVAGLIETTTGGVKFPDGTIQTTAGGGGSSGVTSLNGLTNNVTLAAGSNVTITPSGNTLTIASTGGILNQTTLQTGANFNIDGNGSAMTFTVGGVAVLRAKNNSISFGKNAGTLANSADDNVFIGTNAGKNNAANNNVYLGFNAGRDNVSGGGNVFVGDQAGAFGATGQRNVFVGQNTGFFNTGNNNSYFGTDVGPSTTGSNNVFIGTEAGTNNLGGSNNVFVGVQSAVVNKTGSDNTVIGANAGMPTGSTNLSNTTVVGANTQVSQSNSLILGNNASVGIGTTAPKAKLEVTGGNILVGSPGQGIILKSPDGATCKLFSIDNAGAMVLTSVACP